HQVRGASDLQREHILGLPQLNIKLKRESIARYGLNVKDVQDVIRIAVAGKVVTEVIENPKRFGLLVRFPHASRNTLAAIEKISVDTKSGAHIPLSELASFTISRGLVMINRENGERRTAVLCNVRGRDLGSFVEELQQRTRSQLKLPHGYTIVWGGQFENQQRAMARLTIVVPLVLLLIFLLLFGSFNSLRNAFLVMLNIPFALIGGILALLLWHQVISVPAVVGCIALFGVAVQNGVIMVSYFMQLEREGLDPEEAARQGAAVRLRPVLMTALVAIVGFAPLLCSHGTGAEVQRPLALVVTGGLLTATPLTLLVLPALYVLFNRRPAEATEPAHAVSSLSE
ncbi:MAG: efflux RND transporter permease subunit, partial [Candidatus Angelobacter sp.]